MKVLVAFSGGKDSLASLLWAIHESGFKRESIEAVFCDTGWEHELTYQHIKEVTDQLKVKLVTLKSSKYDGFVDMAKKKGRFPSATARFCTEELKTKPMIDYVLSHSEHLLIIQGIRADESKSRSLMAKQCSYFKHYFEPYATDSKGKPKTFSYRKADVKAFKVQYSDDIIRPVFDWTGQQVMQYILEHGLKPNPLYYQGFSRVGCFPCIMCRQGEIKQMLDTNPDYIQRLEDAEAAVGSTFFSPEYVPVRYSSRIESNGKKSNTAQDVTRYLKDKAATGDLFPEEPDTDRRCMSFYAICE